jgi:hypothetical protein
MRTLCKDCIFGSFVDMKQEGCVLGKLDIYKQQGADITRELYEPTDKEYYVINNRYCMSCRNSKWLESLPEGEDHLQKLKDEIEVQCQVIVFDNSNEEDLIKTIESVKSQTTEPLKITVAHRPSSQTDVTSLSEKLQYLGDIFEIRVFLEEYSDGKCIDMCTSQLSPQYYCIVQSGFIMPSDTLYNLNDFVNEKLMQFSIIEADDDNNCMFVPYSVHRVLQGNSGKPLVKKIEEEEWTVSAYPIATMSPSIEK